LYSSPLKELHWLRVIIDEGHEFSSATSNAVLVAQKFVTADRRWVVSGTPARDRLFGVEVDLAADVDDGNNLQLLEDQYGD
jgi:SNF2 family DNA or RNA helicase